MTAGPGVISSTNPAPKNTPNVDGSGTVLPFLPLEADARHDRQRRVLREARVGERQPAPVERRARRTDDIRMAAFRAQPDARVDEIVAGRHPVSLSL